MLRLISAIKEYLVALGPGADDIDEQVSPGDGGDKAGVAGACGMRRGKLLHRMGRGHGPGPRGALLIWR